MQMIDKFSLLHLNGITLQGILTAVKNFALNGTVRNFEMAELSSQTFSNTVEVTVISVFSKENNYFTALSCSHNFYDSLVIISVKHR